MTNTKANRNPVIEYINQDIACKQLIAAVVGLAVQDCCLGPIKTKYGYKIKTDAMSALRFIFDHGDGYFNLLDIDRKMFCKKLMKKMYSKEPDNDFQDYQKRNFRMNFNQFLEHHGDLYEAI